MRDRQRLELKPGEYADAKERERQRIGVELREHLRASRAEPWYVEGLATARAAFGETPYPHEGKPSARR